MVAQERWALPSMGALHYLHNTEKALDNRMGGRHCCCCCGALRGCSRFARIMHFDQPICMMHGTQTTRKRWHEQQHDTISSYSYEHNK